MNESTSSFLAGVLLGGALLFVPLTHGETQQSPKRAPTYILVLRTWSHPYTIDGDVFLGGNNFASGSWTYEYLPIESVEEATAILEGRGKTRCCVPVEDSDFVGLWKLGKRVTLSLTKTERSEPHHVEVEERRWTEYEWRRGH